MPLPRDPAAAVVVSTAIRGEQPESWRSRVSAGSGLSTASQALALVASGMRFVGVAGAHGKTSTSGMLAINSVACGLDPSGDGRCPAAVRTVRTLRG